MTTSTSRPNRVWLITGTSTGLGRQLAETLIDRGERVAATARDVTAIKDLAERAPEQVLTTRLDVTDEASINDAVNATIDRFGRIDVLVNNAGHGFIGALEELTDAQLRAVLDTNVLGVAAVTRAVLPHLRAQRGGHIVQLSSVGGAIGNPGHAAYATSKFALEGMSEALAGEVAPFNIRVSIIEPGPFRTDFFGRSMNFAEPIDDYRDTAVGALRTRFQAADGNQPNDPARAAVAIITLVDRPDSPLRLPLGPEALTRIRAKLTAQLDDLAAWEELSVNTRFTEDA